MKPKSFIIEEGSASMDTLIGVLMQTIKTRLFNQHGPLNEVKVGDVHKMCLHMELDILRAIERELLK